MRVDPTISAVVKLTSSAGSLLVSRSAIPAGTHVSAEAPLSVNPVDAVVLRARPGPCDCGRAHRQESRPSLLLASGLGQTVGRNDRRDQRMRPPPTSASRVLQPSAAPGLRRHRSDRSSVLGKEARPGLRLDQRQPEAARDPSTPSSAKVLPRVAVTHRKAGEPSRPRPPDALRGERAAANTVKVTRARPRRTSGKVPAPNFGAPTCLREPSRCHADWRARA